ncbi:hypothetical protein DMENIID0001_122080 [Sergentomyia squamirostris]
MACSRNLASLIIVFTLLVQNYSFEEIPTTTTIDDLTTTDLEDLFKAYDAQYPQQTAIEINNDEEYQNDGKVSSVLEDIDRVIVSIEKVIGELQKELSTDEAPIQRRKRIPEGKDVWDVGQLVDKAANQLIVLNRLQQMKKKQLKAIDDFLSTGSHSEENIKPQLRDPHEIMQEHTIDAMRALEAEKKQKMKKKTDDYRKDDSDSLPHRQLLNLFMPTTPTTTDYPRTRGKLVVESDDFYDTDEGDRRTRSIDYDFFRNLGSYLMQSFAEDAEAAADPTKREIDEIKRADDAQNELENDLLRSSEEKQPEDHSKNESPLVESIQTIADPETRLEFTKDVHPKIEELEEVAQESLPPVHLTVIEEDGTVIELTEKPSGVPDFEYPGPIDQRHKIKDVTSEEPPKDVIEGETDKREVISTDPPVIVTTTEEIPHDTTLKFHEITVIEASNHENEIETQEISEKPTEKITELPDHHEGTTEQTNIYNEETTIKLDIREETRQILAEDRFEEKILLPTEDHTTLSPVESKEEVQSSTEILTLEEHFATDFPTIKETTTPAEEIVTEVETTEVSATTEASTPCKNLEKKIEILKNELNEAIHGSSSSSSSSSEETSEKYHTTVGHLREDLTTPTSEWTDVNDNLSKGELFDLLSHPVGDFAKPSRQEDSEDSEDEIWRTKSRALDLSKVSIISQSPEEISAIDENIDPTSDNHAVKKKVLTNDDLPVTTENTGEAVEKVLQSIVDTVDMVMDAKKTIESFPTTLGSTETSLATDHSPSPTKNTRNVVGFGRDDSPLMLEESLPLDRTPTRATTVLFSTAVAAMMLAIIMVATGLFIFMKRTRDGIDLVAV